LPDVLFYSAISLLAFIGLGWALRHHLQQATPLVFPLVFFPIVYYLTHQDDGRFRHPIDPVVIIFAACGACLLVSNLTSRLGWGASQEPTP
jgi:hypothetical protein